MISLVLALALSQAPADAGVSVDAGAELPANFYAHCTEAPPLEPVDGGFFLPELRAQRIACMLVTSEREVVRVNNEKPGWVPWVIGVGAGLAVGVATGWCVGTECWKTKP